MEGFHCHAQIFCGPRQHQRRGKLAILAGIEEPEVIAKILAHLQSTAPDQYSSELPLGARAPPAQSRLL